MTLPMLFIDLKFNRYYMMCNLFTIKCIHKFLNHTC
jgi:hypothetical protein